MAAISQTTFSFDFITGKFYIFIQILLNFSPKGPIENNTALV